jgi:hypothetical protein
MKPLAERFWSKVNKDGPIPEHCPELGPCWVWTAAILTGYGIFQMKEKGAVRAHRVSWFLKHGKWPEACGCHKCDNKACVNPDHLFDGTDYDNNHDRWKKGNYRRTGGSFGGADDPKRMSRRVKLSESQLTEIRSGPLSSTELSAKFSISKSTVQRIRRGEIYTHAIDADDRMAADRIGALLASRQEMEVVQ